MKKSIIATLAALVLLFTGCSAGKAQKPSSKTPEELTALYTAAITEARSKEDNDSIAIATSPDDEMANMVFPLIDFADEDAQAYAISISPMNIRAYGIALIKPEEGKHDKVLAGLNTFVENQQKAFEFYLPDQYEIAKKAKVTELEDGTLVLVMCENSDAVLESITKKVIGG